MRLLKWLADGLNLWLRSFFAHEVPPAPVHYDRKAIIAEVEAAAAKLPKPTTMEEKLEQILGLPFLPEKFKDGDPSFFGMGFNLCLDLLKEAIRDSMQLPHRTLHEEFEAHTPRNPRDLM